MIATAVRAGRGFAAAAMLMAVAACAGTNTAGSTSNAAAGSHPYQGQYKIGKPYQIKGIWYYPHIDYGYDEVGVASWYGPGFHGEQTANGETYDMNELTAAHKTLPLPSIVRVTNLENGRTVKLRVNDRGPFVGDRIIDVSRTAAQMLGFHRAGTAVVRVQIEAEESQQLAAALTGAPAVIGTAALAANTYAPPAPAAPPPPAPPLVVPTETVLAANNSPPPADVSETPDAMAGSGGNDDLPAVVIGETAAPIVIAAAPPQAAAVPLPPVVPTPAHFVQAGAFADPVNVAKARAKLNPLGPVEVTPLSVEGRELVQVRVGPLGSEAEAQRVLVAALRAGFPGSRLVIE